MSFSNDSYSSKSIYQAKFASLELAETHAMEKSREQSLTLHIIVSSDFYWVNASSELLEWEQLCATYVNGKKVKSYHLK